MDSLSHENHQGGANLNLLNVLNLLKVLNILNAHNTLFFLYKDNFIRTPSLGFAQKLRTIEGQPEADF